jgi:hypothetical protein
MPRSFDSCPARSAACNAALLTRDPAVVLLANRGPGSAMHHFVLHRIRDTDAKPTP